MANERVHGPCLVFDGFQQLLGSCYAYLSSAILDCSIIEEVVLSLDFILKILAVE